jgi:hypothetical protein
MARGKQFTIKITGSAGILTAAMDIAWDGYAWATEETTPNDSNVYTTRAPTVRTDGPIALTLKPFNPSDADHAALRSANAAGTTVEITLTAPNGDAWDGTCAVTAFKPVTPATGLFAYTVTLTPLDAMAFTAA